MAKAKITYRVGREAIERSMASRWRGCRNSANITSSPSRRLPSWKGKKLVPLIQMGKIEPAGTGDHKVQAYNFRMCI